MTKYWIRHKDGSVLGRHGNRIVWINYDLNKFAAKMNKIHCILYLCWILFVSDNECGLEKVEEEAEK